jgi:hypothetical protein
MQKTTAIILEIEYFYGSGFLYLHRELRLP